MTPIEIGGYSFSILTAVTAVVGLMWLLTLLLAAVLPARKDKGGFSIRAIDIFVIIMSIAFGGAWFSGLLQKEKTAKTEVASTNVRSCVSVQAGQSSQKVRELLGEPDEIRNEEEVRGAGADVWIYRDSRCAVHNVLGTVISVE